MNSTNNQLRADWDQLYPDWSLRNGVTGVFNDETDVKHWEKGTDQMLDAIKGRPHQIIMESTVHSFVPTDRAAFIKRCADEGHELLFTPARLTGRWTREKGRKKSDYTDPLTIRDIAGRAHLRKPHETSSEWVEKRELANYELMLLRSTGLRDAFAETFVKRLPDYETLDAVRKASLGNGKGYNLTLIGALGKAFEHATSRKEFERLCGLYAHAYPSQIRADVFHWQWSGGARRGRLNGVRLYRDDENPNDPKHGGFGLRKRDDLTLSEFRRSIRWVYSQLVSTAPTTP